MRNFFFCLLFVGWFCNFIGCTKEYVEPTVPVLDVAYKSNISRKLNKDEVLHLAGLYAEPMKTLKLRDTLPIVFTDAYTRSFDNAVTVEPIVYEGDTLMWAANYPENGGYMLLTVDKLSFPVERYAETGNFNYDSLPIAEKEGFNLRLKEIKSQITFPRDSIPFSVMDTLNYKLRGDTTCKMTITFYPTSADDGDPTALGDKCYFYDYDYDGTLGRDYSTHQTVVWPCLPRILERKWSVFQPYNADMPKGQYVQNENRRINVCAAALLIALIMDHNQFPDNIHWMGMPHQMQTDQSNQLTKLLSLLSDDLGYEQMLYGDNSHLLSNKIVKIIPTLQSKYGFGKSMWLCDYGPDPTSFNRVHSSLCNFQPILYFPAIADNLDYYDRSTEQCMVIDGYREVCMEIKKRYYIFGMWNYKTEVFYVYRDFFHFVSPLGREYDCWAQWNHKMTRASGYSNYILNLYPYL